MLKANIVYLVFLAVGISSNDLYSDSKTRGVEMALYPVGFQLIAESDLTELNGRGSK